MKSFRADALRLILSFEAPRATVDRFGTEDEVDFVAVRLDVEAALLVDRVEDVRLDEERDEEACPPFCAATVTGNSMARAMNTTPMRLSIVTLSVLRNLVGWDYRVFSVATQAKAGQVITSALQGFGARQE